MRGLLTAVGVVGLLVTGASMLGGGDTERPCLTERQL
jgi:hypothetical protein